MNPGDKTLLLVEDDILIAMQEQRDLEDFGYHVRSAYSGEEAVEIFSGPEEPEIDLILMDIDLGSGILGTEAASLILEKRDIPIVFLSSHIEPAIVEKTEQVSSYGYVVKNSGTTVLDASIKMAFKLFESRRKSRDLQNTVTALPTHVFRFREKDGHYELVLSEGIIAKKFGFTTDGSRAGSTSHSFTVTES